MAKHDQAMRASRDNLIDRLGFGLTYPVIDINVLDDNLKVPADATGKIPLEYSQNGVTYELYDSFNDPLEQSQHYIAEGTGDEITITTPPIIEDVTFSIKATKTLTGQSSFLEQTAVVRMGLDLDLDTDLTNGLKNFYKSNARLYTYGAAPTVRVRSSQEEMRYQLKRIDNGKEIAVSDVVTGTGIGNNIYLTYKHEGGLTEDATLRVRVERYYESTGHTDSDLLETVLTASIMATPTLALYLGNQDVNNPQATIAYGATTLLNVANSQVSCEYRILARTIINEDIEFVNSALTEGQQLNSILDPGIPRVTSGFLSDDDNVYITAHEYDTINDTKQPTSDIIPEGYSAITEYKQGNSGVLSIELPEVKNDTLFIVQTRKQHKWTKINNSFGTSLSYIYQKQVLPLLVEPNLATPLIIRLHVSAGKQPTYSQLHLFNGEMGVYYQLWFNSNNEPDITAYFHEWSNENVPAIGLGELRLGRDLAIIDGHSAQVPNSHEIDVSTKDASISVRAKQGVTQVEQLFLAKTTLPPITVFENTSEGKTLQITIKNSLSNASYAVYGDEVKASKELKGNGGDLILVMTASKVTGKPSIILRTSHEVEHITVEVDQIITLPTVT